VFCLTSQRYMRVVAGIWQVSNSQMTVDCGISARNRFQSADETRLSRPHGDA